MAGSGRRYAPEFKARMVELVRGGAKSGPPGKGVRAVRDGDPALGGAGGWPTSPTFPLRRAPTLAVQVTAGLAEAPAVALLGARQVGKTTLARRIAASWPGPATIFDLEVATNREALSRTPVAAARA